MAIRFVFVAILNDYVPPRLAVVALVKTVVLPFNAVVMLLFIVFTPIKGLNGDMNIGLPMKPPFIINIRSKTLKSSLFFFYRFNDGKRGKRIKVVGSYFFGGHS